MLELKSQLLDKLKKAEYKDIQDIICIGNIFSVGSRGIDELENQLSSYISLCKRLHLFIILN